MELYFHKWKKTDLAKMLCQGDIKSYQDIPITRYSDYTMLSDFADKIADATRRTPRKTRELLKDYYNRISHDIGASLDRYMIEPYYLCIKTTGTTGANKWVADGETFWKNFASGAIATFAIACSDGWGETQLSIGDKCLNMAAPIPYVSGWGAVAASALFELVPPIEVTDFVRDMKETSSLMLKAIRRGEKIVLGGGIGSMFYMMCKYFVEPAEFYKEYYRSTNFGLKKMLLLFKLLQSKLSSKERKNITDYMPLKGVIVGGMEARLYIDFFRKEFDLEPLHAYGSTEGGNLMRGDPDRKTDLVPDLKTGYLEFQTEDGEVRDLDELKRGEIYDLVLTPLGSILFRYDMQDLFRVIDFRDDGMPIFAFEGRKKAVIRLYSPYIISPNIIVQALSKAGLRSSDKWAVVKLLKPREHLHFVMEKTWTYSKREAEKVIFNSLLEMDKIIPHRGETLTDYVADFGIKDPSEVVEVEYLRPGAFLRYSMIKAKAGAPLGQYKPPKIIPTEKMGIYDTLRSA